MRFEELGKILASWNPRSYRKQIAVKQKVLFRRVFFGLILSLVFMLLVSLPLLIQLPSKVEEKAESFDELNISVNFATHQTIELSKIPRIVVDAKEENISKEKVLINNQGIIINKAFSKKNKVYAWSSLASAQNIVSEYSKSIQVIILLLIPSLLIALSILAIFEAIVLMSLSIVLTKIMCVFTKKQLSFGTAAKIASLALIPFFMIQVIPFFYIRWWSIPLLAYVLLMIAASYFTSEDKEDFRKKKQGKKRKHKHEIHFSEEKEDAKKSGSSDNF